jgi:hypothetical protein
MYHCTQQISPANRAVVNEFSSILFRFRDQVTASICSTGWKETEGSLAADDFAFIRKSHDEEASSQHAKVTVSNVIYYLTHLLVDSLDGCAALFASNTCGLSPLTLCRSGTETAAVLLWTLDSLEKKPPFGLDAAKLRYARALTVEHKNLRESSEHLKEFNGTIEVWKANIEQIESSAQNIGLEKVVDTGGGCVGFDSQRYPKSAELSWQAIKFAEHCLREGGVSESYEKGMYALLSTSTHGLYYFAQECIEAKRFPDLPLATAALYLGFLSCRAFYSVCTYLGFPSEWSETLNAKLIETFNKFVTSLPGSQDSPVL